MTADPWAALEAQRCRRHWRNWPWGWVGLALALLAWAALGHATLLAAASMRMPGDGGAPRWQHTMAWVSLCTAAAAWLAGAVAAVMGWHMRGAHASVLTAGGMLLALCGVVVWMVLGPR